MKITLSYWKVQVREDPCYFESTVLYFELKRKQDIKIKLCWPVWLKCCVSCLVIGLLTLNCVLGDNRLHKDPVYNKGKDSVCCAKCNSYLH